MGRELLSRVTDLPPWAVVLGVVLTILLVTSIWVEADGWWYCRQLKKEMEDDDEQD